GLVRGLRLPGERRWLLGVLVSSDRPPVRTCVRSQDRASRPRGNRHHRLHGPQQRRAQFDGRGRDGEQGDHTPALLTPTDSTRGSHMPKPVTPQEMFDLWQKMVNPGAYPLQSLMFPVLDPKEIDKRIAELETVEHWLKANLNLLRLSIQSLEYQRSMLEGGGNAAAAMRGEGDAPNPAMWAWNMMAQAGKSMSDAAQSAAKSAGASQAAKPKASRKRRK